MKNIFKLLITGTMALTCLVGCQQAQPEKKEETVLSGEVDEEATASILAQDNAGVEVQAENLGSLASALPEAAAAAKEDAEGSKFFFDDQDLVISHRTFLLDETSDYAEFITVFYGSTSGKMTKLVDEVHYRKSKGYELYMLDGLNLDSIYKDFSKYDFTSIDTMETNTDIIFMANFNDLDKNKNFLELEKMGLMSFIGDASKAEYVDANFYCKSLEGKTRELTLTELSDYDIQCIKTAR